MAGRRVAYRVIDDEAVLVELETGRYYGLDAVGTRIWSLLVETGSIAESTRRLLDEFDVEPAVLNRDLEEIVDGLVDRHLLDRVAVS